MVNLNWKFTQNNSFGLWTMVEQGIINGFYAIAKPGKSFPFIKFIGNALVNGEEQCAPTNLDVHITN